MIEFQLDRQALHMFHFGLAAVFAFGATLIIRYWGDLTGGELTWGLLFAIYGISQVLISARYLWRLRNEW